MTKETSYILVKAILTMLGSFLLGTEIFGYQINLLSWEAIGGLILSGVSMYWSIADKEFTEEKIQAFMRQFLLIAGGFMVAKGRLTQEQLNQIIGLAVIVVPIFQSYVSKKKATKIQTGEYDIEKLAAIPEKPAAPAAEPIPAAEETEETK